MQTKKVKKLLQTKKTKKLLQTEKGKRNKVTSTIYYMYKKIYLKRGKEESLKRFHPWIFSGAINKMDEGIEEGEIVRVITSGGDFIAVGHYQIGSIAVRVL